MFENYLTRALYARIFLSGEYVALFVLAAFNRTSCKEQQHQLTKMFTIKQSFNNFMHQTQRFICWISTSRDQNQSV